jgi:hypothetical protein
MDAILDLSVTERPVVAAGLAALNRWYAAHSMVRRLWALHHAGRMRVIVILQPTLDGDDIYPAWLAKGREWIRELEVLMNGPVQLEVMEESSCGPLSAAFEGVIVADLSWRDSTDDSRDP